MRTFKLMWVDLFEYAATSAPQTLPRPKPWWGSLRSRSGRALYPD